MVLTRFPRPRAVPRGPGAARGEPQSATRLRRRDMCVSVNDRGVRRHTGAAAPPLRYDSTTTAATWSVCCTVDVADERSARNAAAQPELLFVSFLHSIAKNRTLSLPALFDDTRWSSGKVTNSHEHLTDGSARAIPQTVKFPGLETLPSSD